MLGIEYTEGVTVYLSYNTISLHAYKSPNVVSIVSDNILLRVQKETYRRWGKHIVKYVQA